MPQAIPVIIGAVLAYLKVNAIVVAIVQIAAAAAIAAEEAKAAQGKARRRARAFPRNATIRSSVAPQQIVYGRAQIGGPLVYINTRKTLGSTNNTDLWWVQPLAGHACADLEDVWVDDKRTTLAQITAGGGPVLTGSPYYNGGHLAAFYRQLGDSAQGVQAQLQAAFTGDIDAEFRGRGITYITAQFILANNSRAMFQGVPQNVRVLVKGKKVYDPRRDPTSPYYGGTGAQSVSNDATWEWSECPPLCVADYLRDTIRGVGIAEGRISWGDVADSANHCDVLVSVPGGTQKRYTCNGSISEGSHGENVRALLSSFGGKLITGAKFRILSPKWRGPAVADTISNNEGLHSSVTFMPSSGVANTFNTVRAVIYDRERNYEPQDAGEQTLVGT